MTLITFTFFVLCGTRLPRMFLVVRPEPFHSRFDFVDSRIDSPASSSNTSSKRGWLLNAILLFTLLCSLRKKQTKASNFQAGKKTFLGGKDAIPYYTGCSTEDLKIPPCAHVQALKYMCDVTAHEVTSDSSYSLRRH